MTTQRRARNIWLTLEETEIIELKQVMLDRDVPGAMSLFQRVVAPRVRQAAEKRGILTAEAHDRLSG